MRLYYVSFFYFNFVLFILFILKIDFFFLIFLFLRKTYSIFKESLTEYIFQDFDGLRKEGQILDLYENKLYVDFGLDAGLEEFYIQNLYMQYALYDISLDFEAYNGYFTFKWNDHNIEELNIKKNEKINFKKVYLNISLSNLYYYKNISQINIDRKINDEDYFNLYNYKNINRRENEEPLFSEENEKYYYNYLKIFFLTENFYDTYIRDNYFFSINYYNFIFNLKQKVLKKKYKKQYNKKEFSDSFFFLELNSKIKEVKNDLMNNSFLKK